MTITLLALAGCGDTAAEPSPAPTVTPVATPATATGGAGPDAAADTLADTLADTWGDPAPATAAGSVGPGTPCAVPPAFGTAAKWLPKDATAARLTVDGTATFLVHWGGLDDDEHNAGLPAYLLARTTAKG